MPSHLASSQRRINILVSGALALVLLISPAVIDNGPALGTSNVDAVVVDVDFTTATQSGSTINNAASGRIADLTVSGTPTGLGSAGGLEFINVSSTGSRNQYLTGNLGTTTSMAKIVVEMVAKFPDAGCQGSNGGSMVFSLGVNNTSYVAYNIYRHSGRIGFNTFNSEIYGIDLPDTTGYHTYKFVLSPDPAAITTQEIWVGGVKQNLSFQTPPIANGCASLSGTGELSSNRVFTGGTGSYSNGNFTLMTHAVGPTNWSSTGVIKSVKITTTAPPAPATTPGASTISTITAGDTQLSVAFTAPTSNGGAAITNYDYSIDNGSNWVTPSPASTTSPLVITGLTNNTAYPVKIRARNSVGAGTASNGVSGTPAAAPPSPPPSSGSSSSAPPAPPSAEVAGVSVRAGSGNSSVILVKLSKPPAAGESMSVTVRLLDMNGKLIQELKVPVNSNTSSIEVPVDKAVGAFNAVVATTNASASSKSVSLSPEIIKAETLSVSKATQEKRLMGTSVSGTFTFTPNSAVLSPGVKKQLRKAAIEAKANDVRIAVTGFAALSGLGTTFERYVAERRALAVSKFLRAKGVESWIYYRGLSGLEGQQFPGQPRRVEIRTLK